MMDTTGILYDVKVLRVEEFSSWEFRLWDASCLKVSFNPSHA